MFDSATGQELVNAWGITQAGSTIEVTVGHIDQRGCKHTIRDESRPVQRFVARVVAGMRAERLRELRKSTVHAAPKPQPVKTTGRYITCPDCDGTGEEPIGKTLGICRRCKGRYRIRV